MRIVLDTVILVRALIDPESWWGTLLFDALAPERLVVSPAMVREHLEVLRRPKIVRKYRIVPGRDHARVLEILAQAIMVHPESVPPVARDSGDDLILAAALAANADFIVSEDRDLLDLESYEGIPIVNAETFLTRLNELPGDS